MRRMETMTAAGVTLAGLGALVGLAVGSGSGGSKPVMPRAQPVEVRTEIIRKTVNVYRREHPHRATGRGASGAPSSLAQRSSGVGAVPVASATLALSTRSSGAELTSRSMSSGSSGAQTVKTRSSGGSSSGSGEPADHGGRHDD
jgi:hypothetical protein